MKTAFEPIRFILFDIVGSILFFPVWWYTKGTWNVVELILREFKSFTDSMNLKILLKFLFTPMFGQYDIVGRLISFYVRIVHFLVLTVFTIIYTLMLCILLVLWLIVPVIIVYNLLFQLHWMPSLYA